jgi:hypothetical protein
METEKKSDTHATTTNKYDCDYERSQIIHYTNLGH